jgi:anti-sigma regulatory factor (Ser/Thr protein kinase)
MSADRQRANGGRSPATSRYYGIEQPFDGDSLVALRSTVAAHAGLLGLPDSRVADLVLVAHELATNAVLHGGGRGRLRLWMADGSVFCEVSDEGVGFAYSEPEMGRRPPLGATGGRGLWIVARLVDSLRVRSGPEGTAATVEICLP